MLTQLARVEGLRGDFEAFGRLLDEAEPLAGESGVANVRGELERGRRFRSSGDPEAAFPLFQSAFGRALDAREFFLAGDAAHMCAISVDDVKLQDEWTERGLDLGEGEPDAEYWSGPLLSNLGWAYFDAGDHERALELFGRALEARERDPDNRAPIAWAQYAVGQTLRMLGRPAEALSVLEEAAATLPDAEEIRQELAEARAAAG